MLPNRVHSPPFPPFDEYVSLGSDCEVGFQIRRILGQDSSSFFNWNVTNLVALKNLLENRFSGVFRAENLSVAGVGMLTDHRYEYQFRSPFDRMEYRDDPAYAAKLQDLHEKSRYLVEKFLRPRPEAHATAYFYKVSVYDELAAARPALLQVRDILSVIHRASTFVIIAVMGEDRREPPWGLPLIHDRYLRRIAPWDDAADGHVPSWDRLFQEFPNKSPMRFAGY